MTDSAVQGWVRRRERAQGRGRRGRPGGWAAWAAWLIGGAAILGAGADARGQIPGIPAAPKAAPTTKDDPAAAPIPAKGEPGAVFSTTSEPIKVDQKVDDTAIEATLNDLLVQYPGVRSASVAARQGAVTIDGQASDEPTISKVTVFAQRVEGVRLVLNKMKTDAEVLTGPQIAGNVLGHYGNVVARKWLVFLVAVGFLLGFTALARLFSRYAETLLVPFLGNSLLRSVAGSIISSLLVLAGVVIALTALDLTQAVLSILGLAGVVGLAVGFAFRDIVENFIASILLGLRRPFVIGDFVTVAGKSGSVLALDTRATTLITPEGTRVWIPNAVIYKETLINASITPSTLGSIEVLVPYESSTAAALEAMTEALCSSDALLSEPKPRALVQALEVSGVRLKATYWMPTKGQDNDKVQSDLRLKIKVGLQQAGITPPSNYATVAVAGPIALALGRTHAVDHHQAAIPANPRLPQGASTPAAAATAADNLRKDTEAAQQADAQPAEAEATPIDHAIRQAEADAANKEGGNLLAGAGNGKA